MKEKNNSVKFKEDKCFWATTILFILVFILSLIFSIFDKIFNIIPWNVNISDTIGVAVQIITAISSLVVSVIGISISLQNDEYFGIKISKLYTLRVEKHFSILQIIVISIILCVINLLYYMIDLYVAAITVSIISVAFAIIVACVEVPVMSKDEKAMIKILKNNLLFNHYNKKESSKELKDAVKYLLCHKNLKDTFSELKSDDEEYNKALFFKLLEFQQDIAFNLNRITAEQDLYETSGSLLENVFDVLLNVFDFDNAFYNEIIKNRYLLTRVLFKLEETAVIKEQFLEKLSELCQFLSLRKHSKKYDIDFLSTIIIIIVAITVKEGKFDVIKTIRKEYSSLLLNFKYSVAPVNIFAIISMHLYYLCNSDSRVPQELKQEISMFINEKSHLEGNTKIESWGTLYNNLLHNFNVDFSSFINLSSLLSDLLEFWIYDNRAHTVILDVDYFTKWYLTNLLASSNCRNFDFSKLKIDYPEINYYITNFGDRCFDDNGIFLITDTMKSIVNFYDEESKQLERYKLFEDKFHRFLNYINSLRIEKIDETTELVRKIPCDELSTEINNAIMKAVQSEWGYKKSIDITNPERCFSFMMEMFPDAINFKESLLKYCVESVLLDIKNSIKSKKIFNNNDFENSIKQLITLNLKYTTEGAKNCIPDYYIKDKALRELYVQKCINLEEFNSDLLGIETLVVEDGFFFNCIVSSVEIRKLNEEELSKQVEKHQRSDGQYVFSGAFMPKEKITETIHDKYVVITVVIKHQVNASEDTVFELYPYNKSQDEYL